jgi:DNA-binding CsgD family transcriptional regulator/tetratricopeptide (TPR) repeat protein
MLIELIEREDAHQLLMSTYQAARNGAGRSILLSGEAGVGKSALVRRFVNEINAECRVFQGGCELLSTPRPLGPVQDFASAIGGEVELFVREGEKAARISQALLGELSQTDKPTVLVFEDIHWADHATLDLIKFLGRRIAHQTALVLITYRDDELDSDHDLHTTIGELPSAATQRIRLRPLSRDGVATLMHKAGRPIANLYEITGGNPFFVTALLRDDGSVGYDSSVSIRDMVFSRVRRLSSSARQLCELLSVVPGQFELSMLQAIAEQPVVEAIDLCVSAGMVELNGTFLRYRHELARQAIEDGLSVSRARQLHSLVFDGLDASKGVALARLVHHAAKAGRGARVLELAPRAAAEARRLGAHREALTYYEHLLPNLDQAVRSTQAEILEGWAYAQAAVGWPDEAVFNALIKAVAIWREINELERAGTCLRLLAFGCWLVGKRDMASNFLNQAIDLLESIPPTAALAIAYSMKTKTFLAVSDTEQAVAMGQKAITLSQTLNDKEAQAHALTYLGTALLRSERSEGAEVLAQGIALGRAHGFHESTTDAYHNLTETLIKQYRFAEAKLYCTEAIAFNGQMDMSRAYLEGLDSQIAVFDARYSDALKIATSALGSVPVSAIFVRWPALLARGMALSRLGEVGAEEALLESLDTAYRLDFTQDILPSSIALIEHQVFAGQLAKARFSLTQAWHKRGFEVNSWMIGALYAWGGRLGVELQGETRDGKAYQLAEPYRFEMAGEYHLAAQAWGKLGVPFEKAMALMHCGHQGMLQAIDIFGKIGAHQAHAMAEVEARGRGIKGLKRGQYKAASQNPAGLTAREIQILGFIADGQSNVQIALLLNRSERTVEHHVSSMLSKTQARNRLALLEWAHKADLLKVRA